MDSHVVASWHNYRRRPHKPLCWLFRTLQHQPGPDIYTAIVLHATGYQLYQGPGANMQPITKVQINGRQLEEPPITKNRCGLIFDHVVGKESTTLMILTRELNVAVWEWECWYSGEPQRFMNTCLVSADDYLVTIRQPSITVTPRE